MNKQKIQTFSIIFGISLVIFLIALWYQFPPRSWPTFFFIIPLGAMCFSVFAVATEVERKPSKVKFQKVYRFYGETKEDNFLLSALMETYTTHSDGKGPDLVFGRRWEKDGIYDGRGIRVDETLKSGNLCVLEHRLENLKDIQYLV